MSYYLSKSNPSIFKIEACLEDWLASRSTEGYWSICKDAKPGDILFIGASGKAAGIYAKAVVESPATFKPGEPDFWVSAERAGKPMWRADIRILKNLVGKQKTDRYLETIPNLMRVARWLHIQGQSCHLTQLEGRELDALIP